MLYLTFGIMSGFGLSLCYVAAVVIVAYYFDRRRSFATGISVCGSGVGTFLFAPLTQVIIRHHLFYLLFEMPEKYPSFSVLGGKIWRLERSMCYSSWPLSQHVCLWCIVQRPGDYQKAGMRCSRDFPQYWLPNLGSPALYGIWEVPLMLLDKEMHKKYIYFNVSEAGQ